MSLEKLLIFGFAIAALGAIVATATPMTTERKTDVGTYKTDVEALVEQTK